MFNKKTVFVLGAGASAECGMPTGNVLKEQIGEGVRLKRDGDYNFGEIILRSIPKNPAWRVSYRDAGRQLAETLSTFPSIDEALHWWRDSKEIVEFGKLSIAYFILRAERQSHLQFKPQTGRVEVDNVAHSWFRHFMSIALSGLDRGKAEKAFENVTLINFNYDRTIEHYLFHALRERAGVPESAAKEAVEKLNIIRPYGCIGALDWQRNGGIPFGGRDDGLVEAVEAMKNIRTFTEQIEGSPVLGEINQALEEADLMIILGFGFHQQNMKLFVPGYTESSRYRPRLASVLATVFELDEKNYEALYNHFRGLLKISEKPMLVNMKSTHLMSELRLSISMAAA